MMEVSSNAVGILYATENCIFYRTKVYDIPKLYGRESIADAALRRAGILQSLKKYR